MIESRAKTRRFGSIDSANALGELADQVVLALDEWITKHQLSDDSRAALAQITGILDRATQAVEDPLSGLQLAPSGTFATPETFAPALSGAARKIAGGATDHGEAELLHHLRTQVASVASGEATPQTSEMLVQVFEAIAKTMLATVDTLIAPSRQSAWTRTFVS